MKKLHGYLLAGLLAVSIFGGLSSFLFKKDIAVAKAKDEEIDLGLKASDFITPSGYLIPTANKWTPQLNATQNPYDYNTMSFTIQKGTVFSADISGSDNELMYKLSKLNFSFGVSVAGCVKEVKIMRYDKTPYTVLNSVAFSDTTLTTYSGVLEFELPTDCNKLKFRVENTNTEYVISNFSMTSYETITTASVSFDMQGHGTQVAPQTVDVDSKVTKPTDPSETGYTFGGWYKEAACTNAWNFNTDTVSADMTLYAKWTVNKYTVTFDKQSGTGGSNSVSATYGSAMPSATMPTRTGYTFNGYFTGKNGTGTKYYNANGSSAKNWDLTATTTLYAGWTANKYTVTFDKQSGTGGSNSVNATYGSAMPSATMPTRTGYTFNGYFTGKNGTGTKYYNANGSSALNWNIAQATTLYASWTANTYNVSYQGNKPEKAPGTVSDIPAGETWTYDANQTLGTAPTLNGYIFDGWYKEATCTNKVGDAGQTLTKPNLTATKGATVNLYAKWTFDPAIQAVIDKINGTKTCGYDNLTDQIEDADSSYNALSLDFQAVVDAEGYTHILDNAKAADAAGQMIEDLGPAQDTEEWRQAVIEARNAYDDLEDKSYIPTDTILVILTDDEAAVVVMDIINDIGDPRWTSESRDLIDDAEDAYAAYIAAGHPDEQIANYDDLLYADECYDNVQGFVDKVSAITTNPFEYTPECKALIDDARNYFESLEDYQQGLCTSDAKTYYDLLVNYENAYEASRLIDAIGTMKNTDACKEKIEAARAAIDALDETTELPLISDELLKLLVDKETGWSVIEKIDAIYPMVYGEDCEKAIETARNAFDALEDDQEQYVVNYELLLKAEEDCAAVKKVVEEVAALGDIRHDEESLKKIEHARTEYNALTPDQKALYPHDSLEDIVDYETAYKALDYIYNIGDVNYDTDSQEKIEEARAFYDSLSDEQKELINISDLEVLSKSEAHFGELKKKADIFVIIMLIVACLAVVGGGLFIFFLLKRRKKDDEEENQPAKAMSVAGVLPIVALISHYVDAPYVALYIIAGVALLVWVAALVLVILKKKQVLFFKPQEVTGGAVESPEEEVKVVTDEKGNVFQIRYLKSFSAKLIQASDEAKNNYTILKNHVLAYKGTTSRLSWRFDTINSEKGVLLKFVVRGKTLCVYYNLNADEVDSKYKVEKVESKRFADVPCLYRIKNARRLEYAKELIDLLMRKLHVKKGKDQHEDYYLPYEETEALVKKGLVKEINGSSDKSEEALEEEFLASISAEEADEKMSDEVAESKIEESKTVVPHPGKKGIINIDDLEANFESGDTITLEVLLEKKLVPSDVKRVKLLARGKLDKKFHVELQDYSLQAVKMVLLVGGSVKRV